MVSFEVHHTKKGCLALKELLRIVADNILKQGPVVQN